MSFRLMNALAIFKSLINYIFQSYLNQFVIMFIDDILAYSKGECEHEDHLWILLWTLQEHQLYAKFSMYELWLKEIHFEECHVQARGISRSRQHGNRGRFATSLDCKRGEKVFWTRWVL